MKRILTVLLMFACSNIFAAEGISDAAWQRIKSKMDKLPAATLPTSVTPYDWLITPEKAVAEVYACDDGKSIMISNGLVARIFRVTPHLATTDIINQMTGETMLRAVGTEGEAVIDGKSWYIGGLEGQPERGYIMHEWLDELQPMDNSFIVEDFEVYDNIETLEWAQSRWALNKRMPTGKSIVFTLRGREQTKELTIKLRFDIYDGVPAIRKSF